MDAQDGFELAERVAGDVAHVVPAVKTVYKLTMVISKKHIGEITETGKLELHLASKIILDPLNEPALMNANLYSPFRKDYSGWCQKFADIEQQLKDLKFWDVRARRALYLTALAEVKAVTQFKCKVRDKSTWARFKLNLENGSLDTPDVPVDQQAAQATDVHAVETGTPPQLPHSPSQVTLVAHFTHGPVDEDDEVRDAENVDQVEAPFSDSDSIFGNPWLKGESQPRGDDDTYVLSIHMQRSDTGTSQQAVDAVGKAED